MINIKSVLLLFLIVVINTSCEIKSQTTQNSNENQEVIKTVEGINKKTEFWNLFKENKTKFEYALTNLNSLSHSQPVYRDLDSLNRTELNKLVYKLGMKLHSYNENVWFEMVDKNHFELLITARGNIEYFDSVLELVDAVDTIENWKVTPFIQPEDISKYIFQLENFKITTTEDIFFTYKENLGDENGYLFEIMIYVKDEKFMEEDFFKSTITNFLEKAVGEYNFAKTIQVIDIKKISNKYAKHKSEVLPLYKLKEVIDSIKSKVKNQ